MFKTSSFVKLSLVVALLLVGAVGSIAYANHSWGVYHWARTQNQFTLKLGDNVSSSWDSYLATTSSDWSLSSVLNTTIVAGQGRTNCKATQGRVEICNKKYGNNGWLGIAQVWVDSSGHITQGTVKMNDTYFSTPTYNTPAWKNLVMCQEVGHTLGLDHQDEDFGNTNLNTCMDYSNSPNTNQHPNAHDYEQLEAMYAHLDSTNTLSSSLPKDNGANPDLENPSSWGRGLRKDSKGNNSVFGKDLGNGEKLFTFVIWVE